MCLLPAFGGNGGAELTDVPQGGAHSMLGGVQGPAGKIWGFFSFLFPILIPNPAGMGGEGPAVGGDGAATRCLSRGVWMDVGVGGGAEHREPTPSPLPRPPKTSLGDRVGSGGGGSWGAGGDGGEPTSTG